MDGRTIVAPIPSVPVLVAPIPTVPVATVPIPSTPIAVINGASIPFVQPYAQENLSGAGTLSVVIVPSSTETFVQGGVGKWIWYSFAWSCTQAVGLAGTGTLSAKVKVGSGSVIIAAGFTGLGALMVSDASWNASGTLSMAIAPSASLYAGFNGLGVDSGVASLGAGFNGLGTLSAAVTPQAPDAAGLGGTGTLSAAVAATGSVAVSAGFAGAGGDAGAQTANVTSIPAFNGQGSLIGLLDGAPGFNGVGVLSTVLGQYFLFGSVGTLSALAAFAAPFNALGTLSAYVSPQAQFFASGVLSAAIVPSSTVIAGFSGSGLDSSPAADTAALSGTGTLSTVVALPAVFSGSGTLSEAQTESEAETAAFSGTGQLSMVVPQSLPFSGSGALSMAGGAGFQPALSGAGTLSMATAVASAAAFSGTGTLVATEPAVPSYIGSNAAQVLTVAASITIPYPPGSASGDYVAVSAQFLLAGTTAYTITTPTGWNLMPNTAQNTVATDGIASASFWRFRGSETSVTITATNSSLYIIGMSMAWTGSTVNAANPVNASNSTYTLASSTANGTPSITTNTPNCAVGYFAFGVIPSSSTTWTWAWTSLTQELGSVAHSSAVNAEFGWTAALGSQAAAGTVAASTCTSSTAIEGRYGVTFAIAPA